MRPPSPVVACCLAAVLTLGPPCAGAGDLPLIPWPRSLSVGTGLMTLTGGSRIAAADGRLRPLAHVLADEVLRIAGRRLPVVAATGADGDIVLALDPAFKGETYRLAVGRRAEGTAGSYAGIALGTATLLQVFQGKGDRLALPRLTITDSPHFRYGGAMLDVARQPHSIDTLKQCVQVCRFYKIRYLHLHLSDENGWVFPSTAYPRLGSGNYALPGGRKPAVYPLASLKELVTYADARGVTLVPEIEMPGHSGQLRGTMPEVFGYKDAAGKPVVLGVLNMVSDDAYRALDTLVGEVSAVFASSPYFHVGCDEVSPGGIEKMPEVRAFVTRSRLPGPEAVFGAFVSRIHGIVRKHGKRMIVWEGAPLDPAPPRDTVFMPWVGGSGAAAELVRRGYAIINAPWGVRTPYFDPFLVNGARLARDESLLLGATSLLWEAPETAAVPYLRQTGALRNEPTYNPAAGRGYADFLRRLAVTDARLDRLLTGVACETAGVLDPLVAMRADTLFRDRATVTLATAVAGGSVRYTLDGSEPTARSPLYAAPVAVRQPTTLKARWFGPDGRAPWHTLTHDFGQMSGVTHDAVGAAATLTPADPGYFGPGPKGLTDGLLAAGDEAGSAGWVGWERGGGAIRIDLDLRRSVPVRMVAAHFLRAAGGIFLPHAVTFEASADGTRYRPLATVSGPAGTARRGWYVADVGRVVARYLRVRPEPGGDWTFIDEVAVNPPLPGPSLRHAALGKPVTLARPPDPPYDAPGIRGLTDGFAARSPDFMNPEWLGFDGKELDAVIDLGRPLEIRRAGGHFLHYLRAGIQVPQSLDVLVSDDGKNFRPAASIRPPADDRPAYVQTLSANVAPTRARFVRFRARPSAQWLFVDELFVNPAPE